MDRVSKFVQMPFSAMIVSTVTCVFVGVAVFGFGAPPIILLPAILITGTVHFELKSRATGRFGRH